MMPRMVTFVAVPAISIVATYCVSAGAPDARVPSPTRMILQVQTIAEGRLTTNAIGGLLFRPIAIFKGASTPASLEVRGEGDGGALRSTEYMSRLSDRACVLLGKSEAGAFILARADSCIWPDGNPAYLTNWFPATNLVVCREFIKSVLEYETTSKGKTEELAALLLREATDPMKRFAVLGFLDAHEFSASSREFRDALLAALLLRLMVDQTAYDRWTAQNFFSLAEHLPTSVAARYFLEVARKNPGDETGKLALSHARYLLEARGVPVADVSVNLTPIESLLLRNILPLQLAESKALLPMFDSPVPEIRSSANRVFLMVWGTEIVRAMKEGSPLQVPTSESEQKQFWQEFIQRPRFAEASRQSARAAEWKPPQPRKPSVQSPPSLSPTSVVTGGGDGPKEYEVDGVIAQIIFKPDGSPRLHLRNDFTVFVRDCGWLLQVTEKNEAGEPLGTLEIGSTNGMEIYESGGGSKGPAPPRRGGGRSFQTATVMSNAVPVGFTDGSVVGHLWLMFASGCHLSEITNSLLTPVYDPSASAPGNPNLKLKAEWEWINGPGSLPMSVAYLRDSGVTNALYLATGLTNVGAGVVPSGFVFEENVFPARLGMRTPVVRKRAQAQVTSVRPVCSRVSLLPELTPKTVVLDFRIAETNHTIPTYRAPPDRVWVSAEAAKKNHDRKMNPPRFFPFAAVVVSGVLLVPLAVLGIVVWRRKKKR